MSWKGFEVELRLRTPMHIGYKKTGNVQSTRPYVLGRTLWGALTKRLVCDEAAGRASAVDPSLYEKMGQIIHNILAFTYFYPVTKNGASYKFVWPWNEDDFCARFLGSYGSTALRYPSQCAEEGSLHEIEFVSPRSIDTDEPVYLLGYIFQNEDSLNWPAALERIQFGGERCYGWGSAQLSKDPAPIEDGCLFGGAASIAEEGLFKERPVLSINPGSYLLAHTHTYGFDADGVTEPLVGREWATSGNYGRGAGQRLEFTGVFFMPGSRSTNLESSESFEIGPLGIWKRLGTE